MKWFIFSRRIIVFILQKYIITKKIANKHTIYLLKRFWVKSFLAVRARALPLFAAFSMSPSVLSSHSLGNSLWMLPFFCSAITSRAVFENKMAPTIPTPNKRASQPRRIKATAICSITSRVVNQFVYTEVK